MTDDTPRPRDDWDDDRTPPPRRRRRPPPAEPPAEPPDDPALRFVVPVNTSLLAIAAGYLGLISVLCVPAPFAVLFGIAALIQLKKNPKQHGHGRAIFGIVMGAICSLPLPFVLFALLTKK